MKKLLALLLALVLLPMTATAEIIVTSFYPVYILTLNLTEGLENIEVRNMASANTGCLHDYQLQTSDMKKLAVADALLINGAGMESYLPAVTEALPELPVVDASAGIELLCMEEDHHHDDHDHGDVNAHVWLDAGNAQTMVRNLAEGLMKVCPEQAEAIAQNRDAYLARLQVLDEEIRTALADLPGKDIITFHEAFPYFARAYGLNVAAVVNREPGDALSPAALVKLIKLVESLGTPPLFTEPQYEDMAAETIARETGAKIYMLDPVVTGPEDNVPLTYYEDAMRANVQVLLEALGEP